MRRADQATVERVRPRVVGTLNRLRQLAARRFAQPGAAVAAHVVIGVSLSRLIAQHDDAFAGDLYDEGVTGRPERGIAAHADPVAREDALPFLGKPLGGRVIPAWERPRALTIALDGFDEGHRISRAALRPAAPGMPPPGCVPEPHKYKPSMGVR